MPEGRVREARRRLGGLSEAFKRQPLDLISSRACGLPMVDGPSCHLVGVLGGFTPSVNVSRHVARVMGIEQDAITPATWQFAARRTPGDVITRATSHLGFDSCGLPQELAAVAHQHVGYRTGAAR